MDVEVNRFEIKELIDSCCTNVSPLVKTGVLLRQEVGEDIGQAETDEGRLRQIVINLMSNALKFTDSGEVSISVSKNGTPETKATLTIAVQDTGTGFPRTPSTPYLRSFSR